MVMLQECAEQRSCPTRSPVLMEKRTIAFGLDHLDKGSAAIPQRARFNNETATITGERGTLLRGALSRPESAAAPSGHAHER